MRKAIQNSRYALILLLVLSLAVVACGSDDDGDDTDSETTGTTVDAVSRNPNLPEVYVLRSDGVVISVNYPEDWNATLDEALGDVYLTDTSAAADFLAATGQDGPGALSNELTGSGLLLSGRPVSDYADTSIGGNVTAENLSGLLLDGVDFFDVELGEGSDFEVDTFTSGYQIPFTAGENTGSFVFLVDDEATVFMLLVGGDTDTLDEIAQTVVASTESPSE